MLKRLALELAFARHIPLRRLLRRLVLVARWRWSDLRPPREPGLVPVMRPVLPPPIFPMRTGMIERSGTGIRLRFLHHAEASGPPIEWTARETGISAQLWRMHLHYMEFLEEATAEEAKSWMLDWIERNPPTHRGFWRDIWYPYSVSLRAVVWMQQLARHGDRISATGKATIARSLARQIGWLMDHLETDIGGNHLIKNAKALLWASACFEGPAAERWRECGTALLLRELPIQILDDGFHFERSLSYHAQVFADLLEIRSLFPRSTLTSELDARLPAMARVLADMAHPDGTPALFNDSGLDMAYAPGLCLDVFDRLFGPAPEPSTVFAYPDAGYYGARFDRAWCVVDCGRIGPDALPAHGHGDVLSFELSLFGQRFVVDQGVFEYTAGPKRQASRSAAHHNTLCLDGADQAEFFSRFRVGRRPDVALLDFTAADNGFSLEGEHDGFTHLPGAPRHRRRFRFGPTTLRIEDHIIGTSNRPGRIGFLLHPDVTIERISDRSVRLKRSTHTAWVSCGLTIAVEPALWWPDLGAEAETHRLVIALSAKDLERSVVTEWTW